MPESMPGGSSARPEVANRLQEIARLLRATKHLTPAAQQELAKLADELSGTLGSSAVSSAEETHLAESTAHLIDSLNRKETGGTLSAARDRLEESVLAAEAQSPFLAGIARRLLDALANLGI